MFQTGCSKICQVQYFVFQRRQVRIQVQNERISLQKRAPEESLSNVNMEVTIGHQNLEAGQKKTNFSLATWRRRLFTKMDIYKLHAFSSSTFMLYTSYESLRVMAHIFLYQQLVYAEFSWIPPVLLMLNAAKDGSAFRMAIKHRQGIVRSIFAIASIMSFLTTCAIFYYDPYFPQFLDVPIRVLAGLMFPVLICSTVSYFFASIDIVNQRDDKITREEKQQGKSKILGYLFYLLPLLIPLWFMCNTSFMIAVGGNDLREYFFFIFPDQIQATFSLAVMGVATGSFSAFGPTLRDRKLISRTTEMAIVGIPFLCLTIALIATCFIYQDGTAIIAAFVNPFETFRLVKESVGFSQW
eukprot:TRINITY_DN1069_c0_g1_i3.p2 TRINITY_DN1069_c0_g1~~TRINITY_DN1069_c0_g1_i3.p2  ORF type:complete len:354 (+),score=38.11 TRINITY_DN1069_c0_g1_i3:122-1183(+)